MSHEMITAPKKVHLSGYQARDYEVIDYKMYELPGTGLKFRGPSISRFTKGSYFTCIGAAQTFGCFCENPYPNLVSDAIGIPSLNLGYGGAGPEFFNSQEALLEYINKGCFLVLQAMSGRSQSNFLFDCDGLELLTRRSDNVQLGANEAYKQLLEPPAWFGRLPAKRILRVLHRWGNSSRVAKIVDETRNNWVENQLKFIEKVEVPIIYLWFSKRYPDYVETFKTVNTLFSEFPQLVNQSMVNKVVEKCADYVEVVTSRGSPQLLYSRFTGEPTTVSPGKDRQDLKDGQEWTHNLYYPSPEMQEDVAQKLVPVCKKYLR